MIWVLFDPVRPMIAAPFPELLTTTGREYVSAPVEELISSATLLAPVLPFPRGIVPLVLNALVLLTMIVPALITVPPVKLFASIS